MGVEGLALEQKEEQGKVVYDTEVTEVSKSMEELGYEGSFNVLVEDDGDLYHIFADAVLKEGVDPLDVLPTTIVKSKKEYSIEDARERANKMHANLLKGEIE